MSATEPHRVLQATPPLPRWFWLLPLLAALLWFPIDPFWASDDFFALHYAQDPARAFADLTHWQYGAQDLWFFWRPLITLSFCADAAIGGGAPFWAHLSNVLAHGLCALMAGLLLRRLLSDGLAFAGAALWAILPGHAGTIAWAVGRVDGHTTVWILLSVLLFVRWCEGKSAGRTASVIAMLLALASKELAFAVAPLCSLLGLALRRPWHAAWPHWALLAATIAFRLVVLGRFGGYAGTTWDAGAMASGFASFTADLLQPWRWQQPTRLLALGESGSLALQWLGWLPALVAAAWCLRPCRLRATAVALCWFAIASVPVAGFFASADNPHNLRYFYLASIALCALLVAAGRAATVLAFLFLAPTFAIARFDQHRADVESASIHRELVRATEGQAGDWYAAGLPHGNWQGTVVQMHFGIDRMLLPPFAERKVRLRAHRPLLDTDTALRLEDDQRVPIAIPNAHTMWFRDGSIAASVPEQRLPELPISVEWRALPTADGATAWTDATATGLDLSSERMQALKDGGDPSLGRGIAARLRTPGVMPKAYRVTVFTSTGYLCTIVQPDAGAGPDGTLDLLRWFATAECAREPNRYLLRLLEVPTIVDIEPSFPFLVEAGTVQDGNFVATHRARQLPQLRMDRGYPGVVRRMLGIDRGK
jgi:hypothetical protein